MKFLHFRRISPLVERYVIPVSSSSIEYALLGPWLDDVLVLGDRLLVASVGRPETSGVFNVSNCLDAFSISMESGLDSVSEASSLLNELEKWFKFIYSLVDPVGFASQAGNHRFTLAPVIESLGLLTSTENATPLTNLGQITDPIRQRIRMVRADRNDATHSVAGMFEENRPKFIGALLSAFVAPILKHYAELQRNLEGLIVASLASPQCETLLATVASERDAHLQYFAGRRALCQRIVDRLGKSQTEEGCYVVLVGEEGLGKSAICAQISHELNSNSVVGPISHSVRIQAPWLPGSILHFGKQSCSIQEIVHSLTVQANSLLLNPMPVPTWCLDVPDISVMNLRSRLDRITSSVEIGAEEPETTTLEKLQLLGDGIYSRNLNFDQVRRHLYELFSRLASERGRALVILDALDEMCVQLRDLDFLPFTLPHGVAVLLSVRSGLGLETWLESNRKIEPIVVRELLREEIPLLTRVTDLEGSDGHRFNERLWEASGGWPYMVATTSRSVRENGDFSNVEVERSARAVMERQATQWREPLLSKALSLLTIFEPVSTLDLVLLQGFLVSVGIERRRQEIKDELSTVGSQIAGLNVGHVKLGIKVFAEYVREEFLTIRDLRSDLSSVVSWIIQDKDVDARTIFLFLRYWANRESVPRRDNGCVKIANSLVDALIREGDLERALDLAMQFRTNIYKESKESDPVLRGLLKKCLEGAAEEGLVSAQLALAYEILGGELMTYDSTLGERWLRKAAESGQTDALAELGSRLLFGIGIPPRVEEGVTFLTTAMENGSVEAKTLLSQHFLKREQSEKGCELLVSASHQGLPIAMKIYGEFLLEGIFFPKDAIEGQMWLERAIDAGEFYSAQVLGNALLEGKSLPRDLGRGRELLISAANHGVTSAALDLATRLTTGADLAQDIDEAERVLLQAAEANSFARGIVGQRILESAVLRGQFAALGESLLRQAAENNAEIKHVLADWLLDGTYIGQDVQQGERLLRELARHKTRSMLVLGIRLVLGQILKADIEEGKRFLRLASERGNSSATYWLGKVQISKAKNAQEVAAGFKLLKRSAEMGNVRAYHLLGEYYKDGGPVDINLDTAKDWFAKGAQELDPECIGSLGRILVLQPETEDEGNSLIEKAARLGDVSSRLFIALKRACSGNSEARADALSIIKKIAESDSETLVSDGFDFHARGEYEKAGILFEAGSNAGNFDASNNLVYVARRREFTPSLPINADTILKKGIDAGDPYCIVNLTLCKIMGFGTNMDWDEALTVFQQLTRNDRLKKVFAWWATLAEAGEAEGHLIVGLFFKLYDFADPNGWTFERRMQLARDSGWNVPPSGMLS